MHFFNDIDLTVSFSQQSPILCHSQLRSAGNIIHCLFGTAFTFSRLTQTALCLKAKHLQISANQPFA